LGMVNGNGTTVAEKEYYYFDKNVPNQTLYYRLAQHDFSGKVSYSSIKKVSSEQFIDVVVAPNPFTENTTIAIEGTNGKVSVKIIDLQGRLAQTLEATSNTINLGAGLEPGLYIVEISNNELVKQVKILKK